MCTVANHIAYLFASLDLKRLWVWGYFFLFHLFEIIFHWCCSVEQGGASLLPEDLRTRCSQIFVLPYPLFFGKKWYVFPSSLKMLWQRSESVICLVPVVPVHALNTVWSDH